MAGAKLLARDPPLLERTLSARLRQPRVAGRPIAQAGVLPEPQLIARTLADRPAPGVAPLPTVDALQDVRVARLPQCGEGRRVAAALGEAVPAEAELVRPAPQPQLVQVRVATEPPR